MRSTKSNQFLVVAFAISMLTTLCCVQDTPATPELSTSTLYDFEREYSKTLAYESDQSYKLIGYKKIKLNKDEMTEYLRIYQDHRDEMKNYFFDNANSLVRIYFPVEGALVEHGGKITEASQLGEFPPEENATSVELSVIGRKQTDQIRGVEGNIVKDGIIFLSEKNKADHRFGDTYVFDFGYKVILQHNHQHAGTELTLMEKASCMNNHGGPNCSTKFGIRNGRCSFNSRVCMDYNGWFTDCVNGKKSNFPGSDCASALARGHCWNELM